MSHTLWTLARVHLQLALLAIGGVNAVVPELQRQVVTVHHWMTPSEFAALFAIAQAAPGPNMLIVTLVGWHVAGIAGAAIATVSLIAPACLLTYTVARVWHRFRHAGWRAAAQAGLTPVTVGLVLAASVVLSRAADQRLADFAVTAGVVVVLMRTRMHPLWLLAAGAGLGMLGIA